MSAVSCEVVVSCQPISTLFPPFGANACQSREQLPASLVPGRFTIHATTNEALNIAEVWSNKRMKLHQHGVVIAMVVQLIVNRE